MKKTDVLSAEGGISQCKYEASSAIEEGGKVFKEVNREILLPMADHTALAAKREKQNRQIPNPFIPPPRYPGAPFRGICSCDARPGYHQRDDRVCDIG